MERWAGTALAMNSLGNTLWRNSLVSTGTTFLQGMANLATVIYLARVLAPTAYGVFSYTWAFTGLFAFLTVLGIPPFLTRQLSRNIEDPRDVVSYGITLMGWLTVTVMMLFLISTQVVPGLVHYRILFDWWSLIFLQVGLNPQWIFSALQRLWIPMTLNFGGAILRLALILVLVHSSRDLVAAVIVTVTTLAVPLIVEFIWLHRLVAFHLIRLPWRRGWQTILESLPMGVISFVSILYMGVDTWILHAVVGSRAVGYYTAGYRPVIFLLTLSGVYFNLAFPLLSRFIIQDPIKARNFLRLVTLVMLTIVLPAAFGGDVVANSLMRDAFGLLYAPSGPVFAVLIWSWSLSLLRDVFSTALIASNHEKTFAKLFAISGIINLGLMLILVHWGPVGTASALVTTQALLLGLNVWAVQRFRVFALDTSLLKPFGKIMFNSAIMAVVVWVIQPYVSLWIDIGVGIVLYTGLTILTRALPLKMLYYLAKHHDTEMPLTSEE